MEQDLKQKRFEEILGAKVAEFLNLSQADFDKKVYKTSWGGKTVIGLGASLLRLVDEAKDDLEKESV